MTATKWDAAAEYADGNDWVEMTEIGLDFLIAYEAPAGNLARAPRPPEQRVDRSGKPLSDEDRESIDDDTDSYLADAGVPPAPRNYRWYVRRPKAMTDRQFFDVMYSAIHDNWPDDNMPHHHLESLERAFAGLYPSET